MVSLSAGKQKNRGYVIWIHLISHERISYVQYVYPQFAGPILDILLKKPLQENYYLGGVSNGSCSLATNDYFIAPHEEVPGFNTRRGKQFKLFQGIFY